MNDLTLEEELIGLIDNPEKILEKLQDNRLEKLKELAVEAREKISEIENEIMALEDTLEAWHKGETILEAALEREKMRMGIIPSPGQLDLL